MPAREEIAAAPIAIAAICIPIALVTWGVPTRLAVPEIKPGKMGAMEKPTRVSAPML